jgi:hypothetical protein
MASGKGGAWGAMPPASHSSGFDSNDNEDDKPVIVGSPSPGSSDEKDGPITRSDGQFEVASGQEGLVMAEVISLLSTLHVGLQNKVCGLMNIIASIILSFHTSPILSPHISPILLP